VVYAGAEDRKYTYQSWANFQNEIRAASARRSVPIAWVLALMVVESGLWSGSRQRQIGSGLNCPAKCCYGPMAVMVCPYPNHRTFGGYASPEDMLDPRKNIDTGAAIIRHHMARGYDLPAIAALYNSGSLCCPNAPASPSKPGGRQWNEFALCSASPGGMPYPELAIRVNNTALAELELGSGAPWLYAGMGAALVIAGAMALGLVPELSRMFSGRAD
jgi:hypothetical protein